MIEEDQELKEEENSKEDDSKLKKSKFIKPSLLEIESYCIERENNIDRTTIVPITARDTPTIHNSHDTKQRTRARDAVNRHGGLLW